MSASIINADQSVASTVELRPSKCVTRDEDAAQAVSSPLSVMALDLQEESGIGIESRKQESSKINV